MVADGVDPKAQRDNQVDYPRARYFFYDTYRHWLSEERKLGLWMKSDSGCIVRRLVTLNIVSHVCSCTWCNKRVWGSPMQTIYLHQQDHTVDISLASS